MPALARALLNARVAPAPARSHARTHRRGAVVWVAPPSADALAHVRLCPCSLARLALARLALARLPPLPGQVGGEDCRLIFFLRCIAIAV